MVLVCLICLFLFIFFFFVYFCLLLGASYAAQDGLLLYITYSGLINNKLLLHIKTAIDVLLRNAKTHPQQVMN